MKSIKTKKAIYNMPPAIEADVFRQLGQVSPFLRSFSLKLTEDKTEAKDLFQDTALRIIFNADKFTPGTNFKAWASIIMRNIFINNYRKKIRQGIIFDPTPNNYLLDLGGSRNENEDVNNMAYKELLKMVSRLPENYKQPFWMSYKGYQYTEIAEKLNAPIGTVKSRIHIARKKLMKMYQLRTGVKTLV